MAARPWLKTLRGERTQEEMARHLGINRAYLAQLELGTRGISPERAKQLAKILDISWTRFFEDEEDESAALGQEGGQGTADTATLVGKEENR